MTRKSALKRARRAAAGGGLGPARYKVRAVSRDGKCQLLVRKRNRPGDTGPCQTFLLASAKTWDRALHAAKMVCRPGGAS